MDARLDRHVDISGFAADMLASRDIAASKRLFSSLISAFGYTAYCCGETDLRDMRRSVYYVTEWPSEFARTYVAENLMADCPFLKAPPQEDAAASWSEVLANAPRTEGTRRLLKAALAQGWDDGLFVPLPRGGSRKGIISLMGSASQTRLNDRPLIAALATVFYERVRGLLAGSQDLIDCAGLTKRETDCMRHVAGGLPDAAIAGKMDASQTDVNVLVHSARMKLGARTRAEAASILVSLGIVVV